MLTKLGSCVGMCWAYDLRELWSNCNYRQSYLSLVACTRFQVVERTLMKLRLSRMVCGSSPTTQPVKTLLRWVMLKSPLYKMVTENFANELIQINVTVTCLDR